MFVYRSSRSSASRVGFCWAFSGVGWEACSCSRRRRWISCRISLHTHRTQKTALPECTQFMIIILLWDGKYEYIMSYFEEHLIMVTNKHRVKALTAYGNLEICKTSNRSKTHLFLFSNSAMSCLCCLLASKLKLRSVGGHCWKTK